MSARKIDKLPTPSEQFRALVIAFGETSEDDKDAIKQHGDAIDEFIWENLGLFEAALRRYEIIENLDSMLVGVIKTIEESGGSISEKNLAEAALASLRQAVKAE